MRAFIGLPIEPTAQRDLYDAAEEMRRQNDGVKWVPAENYHITVLFLGDIDGSEESLITGLLDTLPELNQTDAEITGVVRFPPSGSPRVIAGGVGQGGELCSQIYRLTAGMLPGYAERRRYTPHVTLGRVRRGSRPTGPYLITKKVAFRISRLVLYESILGSGGARYREIHQVPLVP